MSWFKCVDAGDDKRFLWFIVCPLQHLFSFKSEKEPEWQRVERETLPTEEMFFDAAETLRRLGKDPKDHKNYDPPAWETKDEVWYESFVTSGFARSRWYAPYWVRQKRVAKGNFNVFYIGWRYDYNSKRVIFPALGNQKRQTTPLHRGY